MSQDRDLNEDDCVNGEDVQEEVHGQVQKFHPYHLLPEEIWQEMFLKIPPKDLYSMYKACRSFSQLLEPHRKYFLFPLILPQLEWDFLHVDVCLSDFLNCRQVCRSCKDGFDSRCQSVDFYKSFENSQSRLPRFPVYSFATPADIEGFKNQMVFRPWKTDATPFITRIVAFEDDQYYGASREVITDFWNCWTDLLRMFGKHVRYFEMKVEFTPGLTREYQELLFRFLSLMPNLRVLHVCKPNLSYPECLGSKTQLMGPYEEEVVINKPQAGPLVLHHLVEVDFKRLSLFTRNGILRSCDPAKLESLSLVTKYDCLVEASRFSNLRRIQIPLFSQDSFQLVSWPLEEARLVDQLQEGPSTASSSRAEGFTLFTWLSQFGGTLRSLQLTVSMTAYTNLSEFRLPPLPNLKELTIIAVGKDAITNLDFMEELQLLEELELQMHCAEFPVNVNPHEKIQFSGYASRMMCSNVWEVCKHLQSLTLQDAEAYQIYHRKDWRR